ncbi:UNKNOWN [Stylonychia lemnae]|uniref:tRNA (guanine(37)-N1)-methyltransferase n=1 Tax=Stylonychia lemnae TaxID=5949 RepID=A0A078BAM3_STYLE|nr:UNKNOWN [Stylonychia lemnae]|eukprot:CDW90618.1 UNKNOWN [Stylonychia lemnae]
MRLINRFDRDVTYPAVILPVREISAFQKAFYNNLIQVPKLKTVLAIEGSQDKKKVLIARKSEAIDKYVNEKEYEYSEEKVQLTYQNLSMNEVLKELLPPDVGEVPSGYETVGDVAHMNLMGKLFDHRYVIGQVVLDKNPSLRTVVTKIGQIESTYRFYDLECIAGDSSTYETIVLEDKVRYKVDVSKVYWCSKLGHERNRMIDTILKEGDVLCDMFCGIGPLAVKAAVKKKVKAIANDLNPACFEFLKENIRMNKVKNLVVPFNMDAREFVRMAVRKSNDPAQKEIPKEMLRFDHCYMNLPVDAVEFLDAFVGLFNDANYKIWSSNETNDQKTFLLPMVHVYGFSYFSDKDKALAYFVERIGKAMNYPEFSEKDVLHFHNIRDVSPQSHMYGTSFRVPFEVAFSKVQHENKSEEESKDQIYDEFEDKSRMKKQKIEE